MFTCYFVAYIIVFICCDDRPLLKQVAILMHCYPCSCIPFWDSVVFDWLLEQCLEAVNVSTKLYAPILFPVETTTILDLDESTDLIVYHQRGLYHTNSPNPCGVKAHGPSTSSHYILLLFDELKSYNAGRSKVTL